MANIRDVARHAGVSASTVSRILSGDRSFSVKEETREKVWAAINALEYLPVNGKPRGKLEKGTEKSPISIGSVLNITVENLSDPSFLSVLQGVENRLRRSGVSITCFKVANDIGLELDRLAAEQLDGFVMMHYVRESDLPRLQRIAKHVVAIDSDLEALDSAGYDHYKIGKMAAQHLLEQGHRTFAYVYGSDTDGIDLFQEQSMVAFRDTVRQAGGELLEQNICRIERWKQALCYQQVTRMLSESNRPTAMFLTSDLMAVTALGAIHAMGLSIPQDVAVMGLSNNEMSAFTSPPLTTIDLPLYEMGEVAADLLLSRIHGLDSPAQHILLPSRLIVRGSTVAE